MLTEDVAFSEPCSESILEHNIMPHRILLMILCSMILSASPVAHAGDSAAARALIDKGLEAQGGEAKLAKLPAVTAKHKGTFHGLGEKAAFTGEHAMDGPDRQRFIMDLRVDGEKLRIIQVLNGSKAWIRTNDDTVDVEDDDLAEAKEEAYSDWITTLLPLKDKAFKLSPLGEIMVGKRPALGVKVSSKGHRDNKLYFDKQTGLLVKTVTRVKDDTGEELTEETFLSDYQDVQGTRQAAKITVERDGELYLESEITEYRLAPRLDDSVFARP